MDQAKVILEPAPNCFLEIEVDDGGVHISIRTPEERARITVAPEDFDDACNEAMGLIYR